jgi:tripartite-type tricarboxylate transporter receptor subunit TctC
MEPLARLGGLEHLTQPLQSATSILSAIRKPLALMLLSTMAISCRKTGTRSTLTRPAFSLFRLFRHLNKETAMFKKAVFAAGLVALATTAHTYAQEFPSKPVTLVMPYSAGGPGDTLARLVAQNMTKTLKQQVLVENVAGAGGTIGSARVANASPDGHTLLMIHVSHATNPALYPKLRYNPIKDFEPIGLIAELPMVFVARKDFPPKDFKGLIDYVKSNKEKVNYGHAGNGSASHLCGLLFFSTLQTSVTTVPYKGSGPAMNE